MLKTWLAELGPAPDGPLFPTRAAGRLSRDAVERLVAKHTATAEADCPSIKEKNVTPHTLRHTAAMTLLRSRVDTSVIALWLGHEDAGTTQVYLHADMTIKEQASPASSHQTQTPAATGRPTPCSRSSTTSSRASPHPEGMLGGRLGSGGSGRGI